METYLANGLQFVVDSVALVLSQHDLPPTQQFEYEPRPSFGTMKVSVFAIAILVVIGVVTAADQPHVKSAAEALEKMKASALPDGVTMDGTAERIDPPADVAATIAKETGINKDEKQEQFEWGYGGGLGGWGLGGWGNWGGWGGYGPYRFGFTCGGVPGWAYPMGYWNMFGAGLYGGSCGLGMSCRGLYYC